MKSNLAATYQTLTKWKKMMDRGGEKSSNCINFHSKENNLVSCLAQTNWKHHFTDTEGKTIKTVSYTQVHLRNPTMTLSPCVSTTTVCMVRRSSSRTSHTAWLILSYSTHDCMSFVCPTRTVYFKWTTFKSRGAITSEHCFGTENNKQTTTNSIMLHSKSELLEQDIVTY